MAGKLKAAAVFGALVLFTIASQALWVPGPDTVSGFYF